MESHSSENRVRTLITVCFCTFVLLMSMVKIRLAGGRILSLLRGESSFKEMTQEIAENYVSSRLWLRSGFINFNGLFARVTGRHAYNKTMVMTNGMLNYGSETFSEKPDETLETTLAGSIGQLSDFLDTMDIPMCFVLAPVKEDLEGELLPEAFCNYQNETGTNLLEMLEEKKVETLDLRPFLTRNADLSGRYFYRTDHHWNGDGALLGFDILMNKLKESFDPGLDCTYTEPELWKRFVLEKSFLGTHGKRVGTLYAGTDDLIWYEPEFETDMSLAVPNYNLFFKGSFSDVNIRGEYREKQNLFEVTPYVIYVGGDYPLVQHRNVDAPNQKKVLFLKDSFGLAIEAFLSTEFSAVDVIDPRYYTDTGIAEYCAWTKPDLVIMLMSPSAVSNRYYNRVAVSPEVRTELENRQSKTILSDFELEADGDNRENVLASVPVRPEKGQSYCVTIGEVLPKEQMPDAVSVVLYDRNRGDFIQQSIFDTDYYGKKEPRKWSFTVPDDQPDGEYALFLCSGLFGTETNAGVTFKDVSVEMITNTDS